MTIQDVQSFVKGAWLQSNDSARPIYSAITGEMIARAGNDALDVVGMLDFAKSVGGPNLRKLSFHARARMLKAVAQSLMTQKQGLYEISYSTGATQ